MSRIVRTRGYLAGSELASEVKRVDTLSGSKIIEKARARVAFTSACFIAVFAVIAVRMFEVSTYHKPVYLLAPPGVHPLEMRMKRSDITDRNGVILATSLPVVNLYAQPHLLRDRKAAAASLATVFPELSAAEIYERLNPEKKFVYIKRNITPDEQFEANRLGIPALNFEQSERRIYPQGRLFSHVLGFVDIDNKGMAGLEFSFNEKLSEKSEPLRVSLDVGIQEIVRSQLAEAVEVFGATSGIAAVMDVNNGEVLALVSLPDFDANNYKQSPQQNLFNQATLGVYEVGSVFKLFNTAMAIESGKVKTADKFDATKPLVMAKHRITDFHGKNRWLDVEEILVYSSNIGSAKIALEVGGDFQKRFLERIGFFEDSPVELPERARPLIPKVWRDVNVATISYGYGLAVSSLHVLSAMSALVNGGLLYPATIQVTKDDELIARQVVSKKTSQTLRRLMRKVVTDGSAKLADTKGYYVGGKTGSAMVREGGKYVEGRLRTTFIGAFPIDNPKYGILVSLGDPKKVAGTYGNTSGWNATPTAGKMIERIATMLGIEPNAEYKQTVTKQIIEANFVSD